MKSIMRYWKNYRPLAFISALILCSSCVQDINIEEESEEKIVVNCVLVPDSIQTLTLTYSNLLNHFYYDEVKTATATLFCNDTEVGNFEKTGYSRWQLKHIPEAGSDYRIKVKVPDWPEISASTTMPSSVQVIKDHGNNTNTRRYFKQLYAETPYWMFIIRQYKDTVMLIPEIMPADQLENSLGTNHPYRDDFNMSDNIMFYDTGGEGTTTEHIAYMRITQLEDGMENEISFYMEGSFRQSLVFFRAASAEYDLYMKSSVQKMMVNSTFDDPSSWFDESGIYSNINNGLGIFAAYTDHIVQCHYVLDNIEE
nr:DUF4249 family protein [uncultured Draconibacterium sp.]